MLWHFRKKSVDFYGDSDAVLGKLHENHLNLLIDPNYSTLFEILQGKGGKHGSKNLSYVVSAIGWNPQKVHDVYRSRFAIESSYRMRNQVKPRTSTRNPLVRYLYAIVSFLLKNVWVVLLHRYFSRQQRGPRTVDSRGFTFVVFQLVVWDYICHLLKFICRVNSGKRPV